VLNDLELHVKSIADGVVREEQRSTYDSQMTVEYIAEAAAVEPADAPN
jgi:hypothetical protein